MSDRVRDSASVWANAVVPTQPFSGLVHSGEAPGEPCTLRTTGTVSTGVLAGVLLTRGKFVFEVTVDFEVPAALEVPSSSAPRTQADHARKARRLARQRPSAAVGWADLEYIRTNCKATSLQGPASTSAALGSDSHSWSFDLFSSQVWNSASREWGAPVSSGDVIGVAVDLDEGSIWFGVNGEWAAPFGVAFSNLAPAAGLIPAVSLGSRANLTLRYVLVCALCRLHYVVCLVGTVCSPLQRSSN